MHQQIKASPDPTRENMRRIVRALGAAGINIEGIAPDFDPPHVRVAVKHNHPYDPNDMSDTFNQALDVLRNAGFDPQVKSSVLLSVANEPTALQTVFDELEGRNHALESLVVLASDGGTMSQLSIGIERASLDGWSDEEEILRNEIQPLLDQLQQP
jgi:hypothetical protein